MLEELKPCPICSRYTDYFVFDHDHATNVPREQICNSCNVFLGHLENNLEYTSSLLGSKQRRELLKYLLKHGSLFRACMRTFHDPNDLDKDVRMQIRLIQQEATRTIS